jgi:ABC-type antimicrobial peptide transport system permease subunit
VLSAIGVYGVLTNAVAQQTRDIGIRMALGADGARVRRSVLGRALSLAVLGVVLGLGASIYLIRFLAGMLAGLSGMDPVAAVIAGAVLLGTAALAAYIPAQRATRVDPVNVLKHE